MTDTRESMAAALETIAGKTSTTKGDAQTLADAAQMLRSEPEGRADLILDLLDLSECVLRLRSHPGEHTALGWWFAPDDDLSLQLLAALEINGRVQKRAPLQFRSAMPNPEQDVKWPGLAANAITAANLFPRPQEANK